MLNFAYRDEGLYTFSTNDKFPFAQGPPKP